ncbi:MAG: Calx-beta domain-containing protein [Chitinophagales bacterium]
MKKTILPSRSKRLAGYSAFAAAFVATVPEADAQIVYTDIPDYTIDIGAAVTVDMDGDAYQDFVFLVNSTVGGDWSYGVIFGNVSSLSIGASSNAVIGYSGAFYSYASAFDTGSVIGPGGDFIFNPQNLAVLASLFSGSAFGEFADVTDKYLALQFQTGAELHYGWMRLDVTIAPLSITIKSFAYDATADQPILAGATGTSTIAFSDDELTVDESAGSVPVNIGINISADCTIGVELDAATTATEGADFNFIDPSPVTFSIGGATTELFDVVISDDIEAEGPETIIFNLVDITGGCLLGTPATYTLTVNDNDLPPTVSFVSAEDNVNENDGSIPVTVIVSESSDCTFDMTLNGALTTAINGLDFSYSFPSPIIFIAGGPTTQTFDIDIIDDIDIEITEDVVFDMTSITGCIPGATTETNIHILDNDTPVPSDIAFTSTTATIEENDIVYSGTVSISDDKDCSVEVVLNGTSIATEGSDFTFDSPHLINFTAGGPLTIDFDINIIDDLSIEGDEDIILELNNVTGDCNLTGIGDMQTILITDDDQVGINEWNGSGINLYSFGNSVIVSMSENPAANTILQINDASGKEVFMKNISAKDQTFIINSIPDGIYFARIISGEKIMEKKIWLSKF